MAENISACRTSVGKSERMILLGRPRHRWEDMIDPKEMGWDCMEWVDQAEDRDKWRAVVNAVMNLQVQ
jgi:hypothetical protein